MTALLLMCYFPHSVCIHFANQIRKEKTLGTGVLSSKDVADLYAQQCVLAADSEPRTVSLIDTCMTIYKRVMMDKKLKPIMLAMDNFPGGSPMSSVYNIQEMISKCHTAALMEWFLTKLYDDMCSGVRELGEPLTIKQIRPGPKSFTDMIKMRFCLKAELLGQQLDRRRFSHDVNAKLREMFCSVHGYRTHLRPLPDQPDIDVTFLTRWPLSAQRYLDAVETLVYASDPTQEYILRSAIKNNKGALDVIETYEPMKTWFTHVDDAIAAEEKAKHDDAKAAVSSRNPPSSASVGSQKQNLPIVVGQDSDCQDALAHFHAMADNHVNRAVKLMLEPRGAGQLIELFRACPLAMVKAEEHGNVVVLVDLNLWGMTATAPEIRKPTVNSAHLLKLTSSLRAARCDAAQEATSTLPRGDIWVVIDGGQNRKALVRKAVKPSPKAHPQRQKDGRTNFRMITLYKTEASMMERRGRRGHAQLQLTETVHVSYNGTTVIPQRDNTSLPGSNRSDVLGPIAMSSLNRLHHDTREHVLAFWGERRKPVGGPNPDDPSDAEAEEPGEQVDDAAMDAVDDADHLVIDNEERTIIAHHQLPLVVYDNIFSGLYARSVIDLTPGTGVQAQCCMKSSVGYVGVCHSEEQRAYILKQLHDDVVTCMQTVGSRFYNPVFANLQKTSKVDMPDSVRVTASADEADEISADDDDDEGLESEKSRCHH